MANKVRTRFDSDNPSKNKVATLAGFSKDPYYKDFLEMKIEVNGVEMPLSKHFEKQLEKDEINQNLIKRLVGEVGLLSETIELQRMIIESLDSRLQQIENEGNL